jgi:hypothetical protein
VLSGLRELAKGLASVLAVIDVCDFPTVDLQMAFAPGCDVYFKSLIAPFPAANPSFAFQAAVVEAIVQLSMDGWEGLRIVTTPFQERSSESLARP